MWNQFNKELSDLGQLKLRDFEITVKINFEVQQTPPNVITQWTDNSSRLIATNEVNILLMFY